MLFKMLRGRLAVTVHVRSHDGHCEVWKEGVDVVCLVWSKGPLYDFRLALCPPASGEKDPQQYSTDGSSKTG